MVRISDWYTTLGEFSFPTVFLRLGQAEVAALVAGEEAGSVARGVMSRLHAAIQSLPGPGFVGADVCAPTDSPLYRHGHWVSMGRTAWRLLATSDKVRTAFREGRTERLTVRPFRRMDPVREFRLFFHHGELAGASQYCLLRHFARLEKREAEIWGLSQALAARIGSHLPRPEVTVDVYLTSDSRLLLVDINPWGPPTNPLLFRTWDREWGSDPALRLIPKPVEMKGDVSVSF